MKVVFISNFFNHHQKHLSDSLYRKLNGNFVFIETSEIPKERIELGYKSNWNEPYVFHVGGNENRNRLRSLIEEADALICGSCTEEVNQIVIESKKLVFRYWERPLKENNTFLRNVVRRFTWKKKFSKYKHDYILCASAYTASDYNRFGLFKNHTYKWGYFPETIVYDIDELVKKKKKNSILWVGRLLDWKHPDVAINMASKLKSAGIEFELNIIGTGILKDKLLRQIEEKQLGDCVKLLGAMSPEQVRIYMEQSQIFLFTSDRKEGWGAVLNEAMNSACAVIASNEAGAVPFLIHHGENGLIYSLGNEEEIYDNLSVLLRNQEKREFLGKNAYETISNMWNADCAAERFILLVEKLLRDETAEGIFSEGPCSMADSGPIKGL